MIAPDDSYIYLHEKRLVNEVQNTICRLALPGGTTLGCNDFVESTFIYDFSAAGGFLYIAGGSNTSFFSTIKVNLASSSRVWHLAGA